MNSDRKQLLMTQIGKKSGNSIVAKSWTSLGDQHESKRMKMNDGSSSATSASQVKKFKFRPTDRGLDESESSQPTVEDNPIKRQYKPTLVNSNQAAMNVPKWEEDFREDSQDFRSNQRNFQNSRPDEEVHQIPKSRVKQVNNAGFKPPSATNSSSSFNPSKFEETPEMDEIDKLIMQKEKEKAIKHLAYNIPKQPIMQKSSLAGVPICYGSKPLKENKPKHIPNWKKKYMKNKEDEDEDEIEDNNAGPSSAETKTCTVRPQFKTASHQLAANLMKKNGFQNRQPTYGGAYNRQQTSNPFKPSSVNSNFKSPLIRNQEQAAPQAPVEEPVVDERLKNIDPKMVELIENEIMDHGQPVGWNDIAGLEFVKKTVKEVVVLPLKRPDIFHGLRAPPKGLLLFGPPGTGKTLIGKCIAHQSKSTFFSISASSLTSKWVGEGEKMVRALFAVARVHQPSVVFIDEIDSLLSSRSDTEHESSRRIKTEFLVQLDGASTVGEERILIVGATNRPQDLDEAARRRLVKRLYVPLPEMLARKQIITNLLEGQTHNLTESDCQTIAMQADGYSGADMSNLCKEAAMGPIRSLDYSQIDSIEADDVRPITYDDFNEALNQVKASVSDKDLQMYYDWNNQYGSTKK